MSADQISAVAAVATAAVAVWALSVAKSQIEHTREISRESTATTLYNQCLELCLKYPKLAEPQLSGGFEKLVSNPETAACYGWFVASMLLSCEKILAVTKDDKEWRASLSSTLDGHVEYFRYRNKEYLPLGSFYSKELSDLLDELASDLKNPPEARAIKMSRLANAQA